MCEMFDKDLTHYIAMKQNILLYIYSVVIFVRPLSGVSEPRIPLTTPVIHIYIVILREYSNRQNDYQ